jgi:hypothetical protein
VSHTSFCLRFVLHPLSHGLVYISNANPACSCVYICKFQFRPIHPPLGDYHSSIKFNIIGSNKSLHRSTILVLQIHIRDINIVFFSFSVDFQIQLQLTFFTNSIYIFVHLGNQYLHSAVTCGDFVGTYLGVIQRTSDCNI